MSVLGTYLYQCTSWCCCERLRLAPVNFFFRTLSMCPFHNGRFTRAPAHTTLSFQWLFDQEWHDPHAPPSLFTQSGPHHQLPVAIPFWIIWIVSIEECSSLKQNNADSLICFLSHFKCNGHTVHMLTQRHVLPLLTSTVKSSSFTHAHSSPLSLAARLHRSCTNHSCYINNGWAFSGQTSYIRDVAFLPFPPFLLPHFCNQKVYVV